MFQDFIMRYFILVIFFTVAIKPFPNSAAIIKPEQIIGGTEAHVGELRYQLSIQENGKHHCGAGIVHEMIVVTIARCLINESISNFYEQKLTVVATINTFNESKTYAVSDIDKLYLMKNFNIQNFQLASIFETEEDFAILKLKGGLRLSNNFLLKQLKAHPRFYFHTLDTFVIAGYGINKIVDNDNGPVYMLDGKLRYADVKLMSNEECSKLYNTMILSSHFCGKAIQLPDKPQGTCKGDSGSPLVKNGDVFVGILAFSPITCIEDELPGIYINITYYSRLITNAIKGYIASNLNTYAYVPINDSKYTFVLE